MISLSGRIEGIRFKMTSINGMQNKENTEQHIQEEVQSRTSNNGIKKCKKIPKRKKYH